MRSYALRCEIALTDRLADRPVACRSLRWRGAAIAYIGDAARAVRHAVYTAKRATGCMLLFISIALACAGCQSTGGDPARGVYHYYAHDYASAREAYRHSALAEQFGFKAGGSKEKENRMLNLFRLGLAAMADGDHIEAERAFLAVRDRMLSGRINDDDRIAAATLIQEDIRIWTGEPYEQAMFWYATASLYMTEGDWENGRAAAQNALFKLRDFGDLTTKSREEVDDMIAAARQAESGAGGSDRNARGEGQPYRAVESEFLVGYLLAGINYRLLGYPADAEPLFNRVLELDPSFAPLVDQLRQNEYDTLLLIDYGRGPTKIAYGDDLERIGFSPDGRKAATPGVHVAEAGRPIPLTFNRPAVDLWRLSQIPRWWSLESVRKTRSLIGKGLMTAGLVTAGVGVAADSTEAALAGLGAIALGALLRATAQADTRHVELLPRCVFVVPLKLGQGRHDLSITFDHDSDPRSLGEGSAGGVWHMLEAGQPGKPRVYALRMHHGMGRGMPHWSNRRLYTSTALGDQQPGLPYVFGGRDVSPLNESLLNTLQATGQLAGVTQTQFNDATQSLGLFRLPGPQGMDDKQALSPDKYRHVVEGGKVLWTPQPGTHQFQRVFYLAHPPFPDAVALPGATPPAVQIDDHDLPRPLVNRDTRH